MTVFFLSECFCAANRLAGFAASVSGISHRIPVFNQRTTQ